MSLAKLGREDRLRLMKFVCSFAWADLHVQDEERAFVKRMVKKLKLDQAEQKKVADWLEVPPAPEEVDPSAIPREHRKLFLETMRKLVSADDIVDPEERENLELFEQLLS